MLAWRLTTILAAMILAEAFETMRISRVAGRTGGRTVLVTTRPCRAPHHPISDAGLIGGGHRAGPVLVGGLYPPARYDLCGGDVAGPGGAGLRGGRC